MRRVLLSLVCMVAGVLAQGPTFTRMEISPIPEDFSQVAVKIVVTMQETSSVGTSYLQWSTNPDFAVGTGRTQRSADLAGNVTNVRRGNYVVGYPATGQRIYVRYFAKDNGGVENAPEVWLCTGTGESGVPMVTLANGLTCNGIGEYPSFVSPVYSVDAGKPKLPTTFDEPIPTGIDPANVRTITDGSQWAAVADEIVDSACATGQPHELIIASGVKFPTMRSTKKKNCTARIYVHRTEADKQMPPPGVMRPSWWYTDAERVTFTGQELPHRNTDADWALQLYSSCPLGGCTEADYIANCGALAFCSYGWYFRGLDFIQPKGINTTPRAHTRISNMSYSGTTLTVTTEAAVHGGMRSVIYLDTFGTGIQPELRGWYHIPTHVNSLTFRIDNPTTTAWSGTFDTMSNGKAFAAVTQAIASVTYEPDQDVRVQVAEGYIMPLATGDYTKLKDAQGISGLAGTTNTAACPVATPTGRCTDWYKVTRIDDRTISLDNSKNQAVGVHSANTGWVPLPTYTHFRMVYTPLDSGRITFDQCIFDAGGFPTRSSAVLAWNGSQQQVANSQFLNVTAGLPITEDGSWTTGYWAGIGAGATRRNDVFAYTPNIIQFAFGDQRKLENNNLEGHGQLLYAQDSSANRITQPRSFARNTIFRRNRIFTSAGLVANRAGGAWQGTPGAYESHHQRQTEEEKQGFPWQFEGNHVEGTFSGESSLTAAFSLTPAWNDAATPDPIESAYTATMDITIRNNVFTRVPAIINVYAVSNGNTGVRPVWSQRIDISNNLMYNIDAQGQRAMPSGNGAGSVGYQTGAGINGGILLMGGGGMAGDLTFRHNTYVNAHGIGTTGIAFWGAPGSGWRFENNILEWHKTASWNWFHAESGSNSSNWPGTGTSLYTAGFAQNYWTQYFPYHSSWQKNPMLRGATVSTENPNEAGITKTNCNNFQQAGGTYKQSWGSDACFEDTRVNAGTTVGDRRAQFRFVGLAKDDYRLEYRSRLNSGGSEDHAFKERPTTDGLDAGVDHDELESAMGLIKNVYFINGDTKMIQMWAPKGARCYVKAKTEPWDVSAQWTTDDGPQRGRNIAVTLSGSNYVWATCAGSKQFFRCDVNAGLCTEQPR